MKETIEGLYEVVKQRREHFTEGSYTCYLFDKGLKKMRRRMLRDDHCRKESR